MSRWFRVYDDIINDPKILKLPEESRWHWVALLCIASKNDGALPSTEDVAISLRVKTSAAAVIIASMKSAGLLDLVDGRYIPHNWSGRQYKSDVSTERVKRFRNAQRNVSETVTETPPETETEQKQIKKEPSSASRPSGSEDFENLKKVYPRRNGNYGWKAAERKFNSLVKTGVDPKTIIDAARRFAVSAGPKVGTEFIPMPASWLNSEDFVECAVVAFEAEKPLDWDAICSTYKKFGHWSKQGGNPPDSDSCRCPPEILAKHGIAAPLPDNPARIPNLRAM